MGDPPDHTHRWPVASEDEKREVREAGLSDVVWHPRGGDLRAFVPFSEYQRVLADAAMPLDLRNGPDLYSYLTMRELSLVGMFATKLAIEQGITANIDEAEIGIRVRDRGVGSDIPAPWIEFKVGNREFAFWRHTMDLYEVHNGAVGDDPIHFNERQE